MRKQSRNIGVACAAIAVALGSVGEVHAQSQNPTEPVAERSRPDFDPRGLRLGGFLLFPSVTVGMLATDNIFASNTGEESDIALTISPQAELRSQWSRHQLNAAIGVNIAQFNDFDTENYEDFFANVGGRLDITRSSQVISGLNYNQGHESRGTADANVNINQDVTTLESFGGYLGYIHNFNRVTVRAIGSIGSTDFDDDTGQDAAGNPVTINNDDRDRVRTELLLRGDYAVSPGLAVFVAGRYADIDFDSAVDDNGVNRDYSQIELQLGASTEITSLITGEAFIGFTDASFDDPGLEDASAFSFGAAGNWNVTRLTSIGLQARRDIVPTSTIGSSSNLNTTFALTADHELRRNVILNAGVDLTIDEFESTNDVDTTVSPSVGFTYLLNRNLSVQGAYRHTNRSSDINTREYSANIFTLGITGKL